MEIPQSRTFESKGRKKSKHELLSRCSNSNVQQDPMPTSQGGGCLKTQDFLQPLERVGTRAYVDTTTTTTSSELTSPHVQQNQHVLPGGIGTYTISHIPYIYHQRDENSNSNCSSYAANGFNLWKENAAVTMEQRSSFSSRSSSQTSGLKSQSFMDMLRSVKGSSQEDDLDDDDEEFVMKKKNNTCTRVDLRVKVDEKGHGNEQKPNTPRSKHSATEQRRRSKINDRFQKLRQLIPNSDQKRDKASFLQEVIEYIHFLQEKVNKHEVVPVPQCLNREIETTPFSMSSGRKSFFSLPVPSDVAMESHEKLRGDEEKEEELSVLKGTIGISSVYSQGLLKTLTETLQTSGVDLSKARISVQIKLSKQSLKDVDS